MVTTFESARRAVLALGKTALVVLSFCVFASANAQDFPTKRITVVVPYAPGGQGDFLGRLVTQRLADRFGQPVIIENRPSVTGNIGVATGSRAAPDGYTVTLISNQNLVSNLIEGTSSFDITKDLVPVSKMTEYYLMLLVKASLPVNSVEELIALMKAKPGVITLGSGGIGSSGHVAMGLITQKTGAQALHVPYKGEGPAINAILGGEVDMAFITVSGAGPHLKSGKLRAIAVTSPKRLSAFPDIPSISEAIPGAQIVSWFGMTVPVGTPRDRVDLLSREIATALQIPELKQTLAARGFEVVGSTPEQFRQNIQSDADMLGKLVKELGITKD